MMSWITCQKCFFWGFGGVLLVLGAFLGGIWPTIFNQLLRNELVLSESSQSFAMWRETPIPMFMNMYLFNWTNPSESLHGRAKPKFTQMGPYVFSEDHSKVNITWNANGTITYRQVRKWIFHPELSNGLLSDNVTNINVVAMTIGSLVRKLNPLELKFINILIKKFENLVLTKTVEELLFEGYTDSLLKLALELKKYIKLPMPYDKFGWFYMRNMSATFDGVFNMGTGSNELSDLGQLKAWNYETRTPFFDGLCGQISGTSGEVWPPQSINEPEVELFSSDICSSLTLKSTADVITLEGLQGARFVGDATLFDNGTLRHRTPCYCPAGKCALAGLRDISVCRGGAPAFISYPHFYLADPAYRRAIDGMRPDPSKHSFQMSLEEVTGIPLEVTARLQINILMQSVPGLDFFNDLPTVYMPMLWFDQHARITPHLASQLTTLTMAHHYVQPALICLALVGGMLLLVGAVLKARGCWKGSVPHTEERLLEH